MITCALASRGFKQNFMIHVFNHFPSIKRTNVSSFKCYLFTRDRLCGLVVRVSGYRYRGPGFPLPDFLSSSWSGTGSTQPREVN
jgi:hypothetical protein